MPSPAAALAALAAGSGAAELAAVRAAAAVAPATLAEAISQGAAAADQWMQASFAGKVHGYFSLIKY